MDLLIKKGDVPQRLSELGVIVTDISSGTPSLDIQTQSVAFKNGKKFQNATHSEKAITVTGYYYAAGIEADLRMQDKLNGVFGSLEPYFIAEMIDERQDMGADVKIMDRFFRHRKVPLPRKIFKTRISA